VPPAAEVLIARRRLAELFELHSEKRHPLADIVVQLAGDPAPLGFLDGDQPPGDRAR
jgi:hypothetical protein